VRYPFQCHSTDSYSPSEYYLSIDPEQYVKLCVILEEVRNPREIQDPPEQDDKRKLLPRRSLKQ
jgi:hypothetical protein